eukprot:SAG31_NODE_42736_length_270_cov_0.608187_2_plen_39_part_01
MRAPVMGIEAVDGGSVSAVLDTISCNRFGSLFPEPTMAR